MLRFLRNINYAVCLELAGGNAKPCTPAAAGTKDKLLLIPFDDIAGVVRNGLNSKALAITLKAGKKAFVFEGMNNSNVARDKFGRGKYAGQYIHEIDLVAFGLDPTNIGVLEALNANKVVAVLENNNGYFKVYGLNAGMQTTKNEGSTDNKDTGGGHELTLVSENESGYADFLMVYEGVGTAAVYSHALTKTRFEALQVATV